MPVLRILVLALAFAQAAGITDYLEAACADACPEQDCDGGACPPVCPSCHCAMRPAAAAVAGFDLPPVRAAARAERLAVRAGAPASPDPHEIWHVPIARAA